MQSGFHPPYDSDVERRVAVKSVGSSTVSTESQERRHPRGRCLRAAFSRCSTGLQEGSSVGAADESAKFLPPFQKELKFLLAV